MPGCPFSIELALAHAGQLITKHAWHSSQTSFAHGQTEPVVGLLEHVRDCFDARKFGAFKTEKLIGRLQICSGAGRWLEKAEIWSCAQ